VGGVLLQEKGLPLSSHSTIHRNLALLHKSKEEAEIDRLQLFMQSAQDRENGDTEITLDRVEMMGLDD